MVDVVGHLLARELVDGVKLCALIYFTTALSLAWVSDLAPGLAAFHIYSLHLPSTVHIVPLPTSHLFTTPPWSLCPWSQPHNLALLPIHPALLPFN